MSDIKVKDYMTSEVAFVKPDASLSQAAKKMKDYDCGFLPVGTKNHLLGVITDRDIVTRAVSAGKDITSEKIEGHMTQPVVACNENDQLKDAIEKMHVHEVNRLIVKNKKGEVTGILSFGGILTKQSDATETVNMIKHTYSTMVGRLMV